MKLNANINYERFEEALQVVDAHTVGEFCRVVISGFQEPEGNSMLEKKVWMEQHYDHVRTALMYEPRGHHDMFGAFLCEPINADADFGVIFMETGGYLNMCGHCTIGVVTVILEAGLKKFSEGENEVVLDTAAGLIRTTALVKEGKVEHVTMTNVPSFLYKDNLSVTIDAQEIPFEIAFGGSFFAIVDIEKTGIAEISPAAIPEISQLGMKLLDKINKEVAVSHPELDINSVDLVEFCSAAPDPAKADMRTVVIFGDSMADRSPGGTALSAKLAALYNKGEVEIGKQYKFESFIGSVFKGVIKDTTKVADFAAIVPIVTGSSYLTGVATYLIDPLDPLKYGFQVG